MPRYSRVPTSAWHKLRKSVSPLGVGPGEGGETKALFDHRRPITCADRRPIQYGEERKFAARSDGRRWWTPEEDRTLLRMRLGGASWGEIAAVLNRGGNYGGRTATFGNVTGRVRFLFNHEIKWGGVVLFRRTCAK